MSIQKQKQHCNCAASPKNQGPTQHHSTKLYTSMRAKRSAIDAGSPPSCPSQVLPTLKPSRSVEGSTRSVSGQNLETSSMKTCFIKSLEQAKLLVAPSAAKSKESHPNCPPRKSSVSSEHSTASSESQESGYLTKILQIAGLTTLPSKQKRSLKRSLKLLIAHGIISPSIMQQDLPVGFSKVTLQNPVPGLGSNSLPVEDPKEMQSCHTCQALQQQIGSLTLLVEESVRSLRILRQNSNVVPKVVCMDRMEAKIEVVDLAGQCIQSQIVHHAEQSVIGEENPEMQVRVLSEEECEEFETDLPIGTKVVEDVADFGKDELEVLEQHAERRENARRAELEWDLGYGKWQDPDDFVPTYNEVTGLYDCSWPPPQYTSNVNLNGQHIDDMGKPEDASENETEVPSSEELAGISDAVPEPNVGGASIGDEQPQAPGRFRRFAKWIRKAFSSGDDVQYVTLGMWHNRKEKDQDYRHESSNGVYADVVSKIYQNHRWVLTKNENGDIVCTSQPIPVVHPALGGPSDDAIFAYDVDENRAPKQLALSRFMNIKALQYVDLELYVHLKSKAMALGVSADTHAKMSREADTFLLKYRVNHIDPMLMLEVKCWTVMCSLLPTQSELEAIKLFGNKKLYRDVNRVSRFKRSGRIDVDSCCCWPFGGASTQLEMYMPKV